MLRGAVVSGLASVAGLGALLWAVRGERGGLAAGLGSGVALGVLLLGLLGIAAIVAGHPSIAMAGALVVYVGQLVLLAAVVLALRDAAWLDGRAFVIGAAGTTVVMQVGLVAGYTRARHVLYPGAGEVAR